MKQEFFNARLLQIQLEMEAVKAEVAEMASENLFRATIGHDLTYDQSALFSQADKLRSLQGDIKALMEEYSKGEVSPAPTPERLASVKEIILGLGRLVEMKANDLTCLGWVNVDPKKIGTVVAALELLLRPADGDNDSWKDAESRKIISEAWAGIPAITKRDMQFSAYWAGFHDGHMSNIVSKDVIEAAFEKHLEGAGE